MKRNLTNGTGLSNLAAYCTNPSVKTLVKRLLPLLATVSLFGAIHSRGQRAPFENDLMPLPSTLNVSGDPVAITSAFALSFKGATNPLLIASARQLLDRLEAQTLVQLDKNPRSSAEAILSIEVDDTSMTRPTLGVDESYSLDVNGAQGKVLLRAKTIFGAMHGFETFLQLVQPSPNGFVIPPVHIVDSPRFPWRGLMLDAGRRYMPVEQVLRTLDGMAAVKLNVLHWHLTEDFGFRIESKKFPQLHELGSEGQYYTQEEARNIVQYASARGIRVVPEFDIPGHSTAWFVGYPELAAAPGPYHVEHENKIFNAVMDPTRDSTYKFLDVLLGEMAGLFPDEYMHIGGDEAKTVDWMANPAIVIFMQKHSLKDGKALQAYFNLRVQAILKKHGKQMVGWDEILEPELSSDVIIQSWRGTEFLGNGARQGHRGFLSQPWYLDHMYSAAQMYAADPLPEGNTLSPAQAKLVLGGEACMWSNHLSWINEESRIWPRSAVVAERLWSPATARDTVDMYRRLDATSLRLDAIGVNHLVEPQRAFRQMAGSEEGARKLALFTSILQPVDYRERSKEQHPSTVTPVGHLADFTAPDPSPRRTLPILVDAYLHDRNPEKHEAYRTQLHGIFMSWLASSSAVNALAATRPLIAEVSQRRGELPQLAFLGLEAMAYIESRNAPTSDWLTTQKEVLSRASLHKELLDFVILDPLNDLLKASEQSQKSQ
ncbi:beta-N-acetylhexosaminidase [Granulicella sibirica]|uniref:beta-N-acetylhexosaminidase n=1 Tax=Granulicella sibirica TaxID=2479048 RepID=A0A4Q0SZT1_9BACT|nr:beta-N-acetylhexosaminidase [Granulicella sibirica]RXH54606.1 Beta-hexosaminidase [Granulicella sibirica]